MDFSSKLNQINADLAHRHIALRIEQRGIWLNLRGPLPSKEDEGILKSQRISLHITSNEEGLEGLLR